MTPKEAFFFVGMMLLMPFGYVIGTIVETYRKALTLTGRQQAIIVFVVLLLFFLLANFFVDHNIDAMYLQNAFESSYPALSGMSIDGFKFPLLYYVTMPFYFLLGKQAFIILPLLFFFGSIAFLCALFRAFKLNLLWLPIFFALAFFAFTFLPYYTRNSLDFFLASAFAYGFFLTLYKKQEHFWLLCSSAILMLASTPNAILFCFLFGSLLLPKASYVFWLPVAQITQHYFEAIKTISLQVVPLLSFVALPLANYINLVGVLCVLAFKNKLLLVLLGMSFLVSWLSVAYAPPDPDPQQLAFRYGFVFSPLLMFLITKLLTENLEE